MAEKQAIVKYADLSEYPALSVPAEELSALLQENLGGQAITPFSLQRIKVPSGGDTYWRVPDPEKGSVPVETVTGIILHNQYSRAYYDHPYGSGENGPPTCSSFQMNGHGVGVPGVDCATCKFNAFGSAENGSGKACSEKRFLFLLSPGDFLPIVIQGPATSLKPIFSYGMELTRKGMRLHQVVTSFSLDSEKHGGYEASVMKLGIADRLSPDDLEKVADMRDQLTPMFQTVARAMNEEEEGEYLED